MISEGGEEESEEGKRKGKTNCSGKRVMCNFSLALVTVYFLSFFLYFIDFHFDSINFPSVFLPSHADINYFAIVVFLLLFPFFLLFSFSSSSSSSPSPFCITPCILCLSFLARQTRPLA